MFFEEIQVFQHSLSTERLHPTPPWVLIFCLPLPLIVDKMVETVVKKMVQKKKFQKKKVQICVVQKIVQWSSGSVQILPMPRFMWFQTWLLLDNHLLQLRTDCFDFFGTTKGIRRKWNVISFSSLFFSRVFSPFFKALVMFYYITSGGIVFRELFCFIRSSPGCMRANALSCKILFLFVNYVTLYLETNK